MHGNMAVALCECQNEIGKGRKSLSFWPTWVIPPGICMAGQYSVCVEPMCTCMMPNEVFDSGKVSLRVPNSVSPTCLYRIPSCPPPTLGLEKEEGDKEEMWKERLGLASENIDNWE